MFLVYNSDIVPENLFHPPVNDRAFQYGDGVFETLRYQNGRVWFWPEHMARLAGGMAALQLNWPLTTTAAWLHEQVLTLLAANNLTHQTARVKIQVWRQPGGLYTPVTNNANWLITAHPTTDFAITEKARVGIYDAFRVVHSPLSAFKTLNALPYVMAGLYRQQHGWDDVILLNADTENYLAECQASNLFWFDKGVLHTPALETGCVNGIVRQHILARAEAAGQAVNVGFHNRHSLSMAEAVFCCNVNGIQWIRSVDTIGTYPAHHARAGALFSQLR